MKKKQKNKLISSPTRNLKKHTNTNKKKVKTKKIKKIKPQFFKINKTSNRGRIKSKLSDNQVTKLSKKSDSNLLLFSEDNVNVCKQTEITKQISVEGISAKETAKKLEIADELNPVNVIQVVSNQIDSTNINKQFISKQLINIKKNFSEPSSPYIIDLKNRISYSQHCVSNLPTKTSWKERISNWDKKIQHLKTNFITSELKQNQLYREKFFTNKNKNFIKKLFLRIGGKISAIYQFVINSFSCWGENKTEIILQKVAQIDENNSNDYLVVDFEKQKKHLSILPADVLFSIKLFIFIALVLIIPFKGYTYYYDLKSQGALVLGVSSSIYDDFQQGLAAFEKLDFSSANDRFSDAQTNLFSVNQILEKYPSFLISLAKIIPNFGKKVSDGLNIMVAGNKMAELGITLSNLFTELQVSGIDNIAILQSLQKELIDAEKTLQEIEKLLSKVDVNSLPIDYQEKFIKLNNLLPLARSVFKNAAEVSWFASDWLGLNGSQRYLLVFQNSNELRPTGGFIGSIAEVDIKNGIIQNFYLPLGGVYDLQGNLKVLHASPEPLRLLNANWQLQDSNWFFDFPTSAKKIIWFYEKSGGPTVDGVIAINSQILPKLLAITGPIELPEFDLVLTADNVINELQTEVEINYDRELNQPKKIIASLMPIVLQRLENLPSQDFFSVFSLFHNALRVKDIQLYHQQTFLQNKIKYFGFGGEVQTTEYDYLAVVDTNIGGGKTDQVISSQVLLTSNINSTGEVINTLKIIKQHNGDPNNVFTKQKYRDYLRVYVPLGSKLISATGFTPPDLTEFNHPSAGFSEDEFLKNVESNELIDLGTRTRITDEFGKTAFGNWLTLLPGEQKEVSLTYVLPNKINFKRQSQNNFFISSIDKFLNTIFLNKQNDNKQNDNEVAMYTLLLQKQSGQHPYSFSHEIIFPNTWEVLVSSLLKNNTARRDNKVYYQNTIKTDKIWGVIFNR